MVEHPSEGNEVAVVYYINRKKIEVVGYWDLKTPNGQYSHFDIYVDGDFDPINRTPFLCFYIPTLDEIKEKFFEEE